MPTIKKATKDQVRENQVCTVCGATYQPANGHTSTTCCPEHSAMRAHLTAYKGGMRSNDRRRKFDKKPFCEYCGQSNDSHDRIECAVEWRRVELLKTETEQKARDAVESVERDKRAYDARQELIKTYQRNNHFDTGTLGILP